MQHEYSKYPNKEPDPAIVDVIKHTLNQAIIDSIAKGLGQAGAILKKTRAYTKTPFESFISSDDKIEEYIVSEMSRQLSSPNGYNFVAIELLYGSHSAEIRLSIIDKENHYMQLSPISSQGYNVILKWCDLFDTIEQQGGVIQSAASPAE